MLKIHDLAGVIPALATPLTRDGGVDEAGVGRLVEHVLAGGVTGLLPLGSTGECSSLDEGSRRAVLAAVVKANAGRVPIICGVAQSHLKGAQLEVAAAAALGADSIAARVDPNLTVRPGDHIRLGLDTRRLHAFDSTTETALL